MIFVMRRPRISESVAFLTTLLACGAFLVGGVKIWGVQADRLFSGFLMVLLMLALLVVLALVVVIIIKLIRRRSD